MDIVIALLIFILLESILLTFIIIKEIRKRGSTKVDDPPLEESSEESDEEFTDDIFENLIQRYVHETEVSIYYANYTKSSVEITGNLCDDWILRLTSSPNKHMETKTLEDWDSKYDSGSVRFVFRINFKGSNYLVWGLSREGALLNLYAFLHYHENTYM